MSLLRCFPRPVVVTLAGLDFRARELTLDDVAGLDDYCRSAAGWPGVLPTLDGLDGRPLRDAARALHDAAEAGPPRIGTPAGDSILFGTAGGLARFLLACAADPLDLAGAMALAELATGPELETIRLVAFGVDPLDRARDVVDRLAGVAMPPTGPGVAWPVAVCELMRAYPGMTLDHVGRLTLSQVHMLRSLGGDGSDANPIPRGWGEKRYIKEVVSKRLAFWAEAEEPSGVVEDEHHDQAEDDDGHQQPEDAPG